MAVAYESEFTDLQTELEKAKENLKSVDENIKKLTGRDPSEFRPYQFSRRGPLGQGDRVGNRPSGFGRRDSGLEGPPAKRRALGTFGRFGSRGERHRPRDEDSADEDELPTKPTVQSSVVAHPKEQKTRKDCMEEQKSDARGMARNRRMFGLLLGTLQKFRVEEQQKKDKEQKRVEIEKKLEEIAEKEKEELKKERKELFLERRKKQADLRRLEYKMDLYKQLEEWEQHHKQLINFIRTKTEPHIFYLPAKHNDVSQQRLKESKQMIEGDIVKLRQTVEEEIKAIGKRKEVTAENEEEEMEEGRRDGEDGEMKDAADNLEKNEPASLDMEIPQDDMNDESKENFPVLTPVDEQLVNVGSQEIEMVVTELVKVEDVDQSNELLAQNVTYEDLIHDEDEKEGSEEREIDTLDPNKLTEKEFEPIYD